LSSSKYKRKLLSLEVLSSNSKSREITEITEDLDVEDAAAEARRNLWLAAPTGIVVCSCCVTVNNCIVCSSNCLVVKEAVL